MSLEHSEAVVGLFEAASGNASFSASGCRRASIMTCRRLFATSTTR